MSDKREKSDIKVHTSYGQINWIYVAKKKSFFLQLGALTPSRLLTFRCHSFCRVARSDIIAKMAALCTGISYGLSQQSCLSNENKELIFVKLTDSAYRAIEEYQKNQVSYKKCALIY